MEKTTEELVNSFIEYLGCPCTYFPPQNDDSVILSAYLKAREEGKIPIIIAVDEPLTNFLALESEEGGNGKALNKDKIEQLREERLKAELPSGREVLEELLPEWTEQEPEEYFSEPLGKIEGGEVNNSFCGYYDSAAEKTHPVIIAEIPVENPWEVFAYLPFGGWNECPDYQQQMAIAKYWYEKYGAVPAVMSHDVLEYILPKPVGRKRAAELAKEQYIYCWDIVDQGIETVEALADTIAKSKVWFFWWD